MTCYWWSEIRELYSCGRYTLLLNISINSQLISRLPPYLLHPYLRSLISLPSSSHRSLLPILPFRPSPFPTFVLSVSRFPVPVSQPPVSPSPSPSPSPRLLSPLPRPPSPCVLSLRFPGRHLLTGSGVVFQVPTEGTRVLVGGDVNVNITSPPPLPLPPCLSLNPFAGEMDAICGMGHAESATRESTGQMGEPGR